MQRELSEARMAAATLYDLGDVAMQQGDLVRARTLFEEALEIRRADGWGLGIAHALMGLGDLANRTGDPARARAIFEEILSLAEAEDDEGSRAYGLLGLATSALGAGDTRRALELLRTCLASIMDREDLFLLPQVLAEAAIALHATAQAEASARVLGAADGLRDKTGTAVWDIERLDATRSGLVPALDRERRERASAEGRAMTPDEAVAYALEQLGEPASDPARTGAAPA
jgi:tetratricopeptide (TPR) repeat protein